MKLNEQNEQQFLASMKPISLLLKKDSDADNKEVSDRKEPSWKDPYPNVVGEMRNGKYVIPNETSTIETKVNENLSKDGEHGDGLNYGNPDASHAKLEAKKNKTFFAPNIKYKTE